VNYLKTYKLFESKSVSISIISDIDVEGVLNVLFESFGKFVNSKEELLEKLRRRILNNLSVCLKLDGDIVGVYLLNEKSINDFISEIDKGLVSDFPKEQTRIYITDKLSDNGIQGIALCVLNEYKDRGYGKMLKDYVDNLGYDYVWGVQDKELKNIDFWKRTRKVFAESDTRWATYKN
jgi:hypothetical protein